MKNTLRFLLPAAILAVFSCCDDEEPKPALCSENVELGNFTTDFEMPYDTFQFNDMVSETDETGFLVVNHPSDMSVYQIKKIETFAFSSDCQALNTVEKFNWTITAKQALTQFGVDGSGTGTHILIKETPLVDEANPQGEAVGVYQEFFNEDVFSGTLVSTAFMRVMTEELVAGKGDQFEYGVTFLESITIKGETFENVLTNTTSLPGGIASIYYDLSKGIVGIKDNQNVLWRIQD